MHSPFQPIPKIRSINRQAEPQAVPAKTQTLKEWSMAGGGVPTQYKGREHVWHAMVDKFAAGGEVKMGAGGVMKGLIKGMQKVLPAAERDANLAKILEGSKVKERLYHATPKEFKEFKPGGKNPMVSGNAIWLSNDPKRQPAMHNISGGLEAEFREGTRVMPVYVQAKNPMLLDDKEMLEWAQAAYAGGSKEFPQLMPKKWADEVSKDYDSVILADPFGLGDAHEVIMFDPKKIKSAISNRGTYDINEPDLNKARGGEVHMDDGGAAFYPRVGNIKSKNFKPVKPPPLVEDPRAMNLGLQRAGAA